jgi:hypothetical protein
MHYGIRPSPAMNTPNPGQRETGIRLFHDLVEARIANA